ncbi:hypothetical protein EDD22DRAFT_849613 [Suillus occidentalis]|nr:hypothetical protein EDD22DRAFT_849613 [Suillus occidentalis]
MTNGTSSLLSPLICLIDLLLVHGIFIRGRPMVDSFYALSPSHYTPIQEQNFLFTVAFVGHGNGIVSGSPTVSQSTETSILTFYLRTGTMSFQARTFSFITTCPVGMGPETYIKIWKASMDPSIFNWLDWLSQQVSVEGKDEAYITAKFILLVLFIILAMHTTLTLWSDVLAAKFYLTQHHPVHLEMHKKACVPLLVAEQQQILGVLLRFLRAVVEWIDLPQNAPEICICEH